MREDLIGKRFGKITVLEYAGSIQCGKSKKGSWLVQCECGEKRTVITSNLKKTQSCGCSRDKHYAKNIKDLTGKQFNRWTVIKYAKNAKWLCQCICGVVKEVSGSILKNNESKSCGCLKKESVKDLTGQQFGKLTVLERSEEKKENHRSVCWKCLCECGNIKIIRSDGLKHTRSCGCILATRGGLSTNKKEYMRFRKLNPIIRLRANVSHSVAVALKTTNNTKKGGRTFDYLPYTIQDLKEHLESQFEPWMTWDNYGGNAKDEMKTWWLDHIIPQSHFNFTSMEDQQFQECWALSNLRPLEKIENIVKGNSYQRIENEIRNHNRENSL